MGDILVLGEKSAGKSTLVKTCFNDKFARPEVLQSIQHWRDQQTGINFYEAHLDSTTSFDTLYSQATKVRKCKICWFVISAKANIGTYSDMIYQVLAKRINIIFIVTKCDIYRGNTRIENDIYEEYGQKHKIVKISLNEDFYANHDEFQEQLTSLMTCTNSFCKIFQFPNKPKNGDNTNIPNYPKNATKTQPISNEESNISEMGYIVPFLNNYSKTIEIYLLNYGPLCKEKEPFIKDLIGLSKAEPTGNDKYQKYILNGGRIILHNILEAINDEKTVIDTMKKIEPESQNSYVICAFFIANKDFKPDKDLKIDDILINYLANRPKIFLSFKSTIKSPGIDVINSDKFTQTAKEERQGILTKIFINHATYASTFNSEKPLFIKGVQKFVALLSIICEQYYINSENVPTIQQNKNVASKSIEQLKKTFEANEKTSKNCEKQKPSAPIDGETSDSNERCGIPGKAAFLSKIGAIGGPPINYSAPKKKEPRIIEQNNSINYPSLKNEEISIYEENSFSILIIGSKGSGKTYLVKTLSLDLNKDWDDNNEEFAMTCGDVPITFIEYHGPLSSLSDIESFCTKFKVIAKQVNCLLCINTIKDTVKVFESSLLKRLDNDFRIPSIIVYTKLTSDISRLSENPSNYNAKHICFLPMNNQNIKGFSLNESISVILNKVKGLLLKQYKPQIDLLISTRSNKMEAGTINDHQDYNFRLVIESKLNSDNENINLMAIGQTGVGKSTLINTILGVNLAEVSNVNSCTMNFQEYNVPNTGLTLVDSRGFEQDQYDKIKKSVDKELESRKNDERKRIHMLWYCIRMSSPRFVDAEYQMVEKWRKSGIPVIIIITNAVLGNKLDEIIKKERGYPLYEDLLNSSEKQEIIRNNVIVTKVLSREFSQRNEYGMPIHMKPKGIIELIDLMRYFLPKEKRYISTQIKKQMEIDLSPMIKEISSTDVSMINIMIIGQNGVGKKKLINAIFDIDIRSKVGVSITENIKQYMVKNKPLSIFDTVGFDTGCLIRVKEGVLEEIDTREKEDNPSKHIHIIWYVIKEPVSKIKDSDRRFIMALRKRKIPIIIVLNNGNPDHLGIKESLMNGYIDDIDIPDLNSFKNCGNIQQLINKKIAVIKTNAYSSEQHKTPVYGTDELVKLTQHYINASAKKALNTSITNCKQKHRHIMREIVPKYKEKFRTRGNFFTHRYKDVWFEVKDILTEMCSEISSIYNITLSSDWIFKLSLLSTKFHDVFSGFDNRSDSPIKIRDDAFEFIETSGNVLSEAFQNVVVHMKGKSDISTDDLLRNIAELFESTL